jgi:hypothetical protein
MRIAMYDGFDGTDDAVETLIRDQVAILQGVQKGLWDAYAKWRNGQFWIGVAMPAARILQIGKFDWKYAVDSWQSSIDTWWSQRMTDTVRGMPFEKGTDGKTRIQAWINMGSGLIEWAKRIAQDMGDDDVYRLFTDFGDSFKKTVKFAVDAGLDVVKPLLDPIKWIVIGAAAFLVAWKFIPSRR